MPQRIYDYPDDLGVSAYNLISTIGSLILGIGVVMVVANLLWSAKHGRRAGNDPWNGNTLEWFAPSPPPPNDFDVVPRVRSVEPMKDIRRDVAAVSSAAETVAQPAAPPQSMTTQEPTRSAAAALLTVSDVRILASMQSSSSR